MRFLHTADWHYGFRQYGIEERETDFYDAGAQVMRIARAENVDAVVVAGDLLHAVKPPGRAVETARKQALSAHCPVYGIDGNHDGCGGAWLRVCGIEDIGGRTVNIAGVEVHGVPYMRPNTLLEYLEQASKSVRAQVMVMHQAVAELSNFPGCELSALDLIPFLLRMGVRYVALGDIHRPMLTSIGGITWAYPGSIEATAYDEGEKMVRIVDIDGSGGVSTMEYPLAGRARCVIELDADSDAETVLRNLTASDAPGTLVHVRYESEAGAVSVSVSQALRQAGYLVDPQRVVRDRTGEIVRVLAADTFDRGGAMEQLRGAIDAFFEAGTDQHQLVSECLVDPSGVDGIVDRYLASKGAA
jgi:DNA repair exonuclease SbcCD nuclease subunit